MIAPVAVDWMNGSSLYHLVVGKCRRSRQRSGGQDRTGRLDKVTSNHEKLPSQLSNPSAKCVAQPIERNRLSVLQKRELRRRNNVCLRQALRHADAHRRVLIFLITC